MFGRLRHLLPLSLLAGATVACGQAAAQSISGFQPSSPVPAQIAPQLAPRPIAQPVVPQTAQTAAGTDVILRRLQQTEAELARLRREQLQNAKELDELKNATTKTTPASWLQGPTSPNEPSASGTSQMGVEDRITNLERQAEAERFRMPFVRLSGFFQYDTGWFTQDPNSKFALGDISNGSGFRRTRLQGLGKLTESTNFSIEMDFAFAGRPSFMDVWGEQTDLPFGAIRIGQFRQPCSMDGWTNIKHMEFLERSAAFQAFDPFRRVGAMDWWLSEDERTLVAASVFGTGWTFFNPANGVRSSAPGGSTIYLPEGGDNPFGTQLSDGGGGAIALRMSHLLYYDEPSEGRYLQHVGGGAVFAEIGGNGVDPQGMTGSQTFRTTSIPEFFVGDPSGFGTTFAGTPNVLDTGRFLAHNYAMYHLEYAGNAGSFHYQSEWFGMAVNQYNGPLVLYDGAYAQCGYFLTGETAGYNKLMGALDYNCKPYSPFFGLGPGRRMGGWGAWEVAARWSYLNLQSDRINPANYRGLTTAGTPPITNTSFTGALPGGPSAANPNPGILNESTVALNWYWNQYTRVQFNWIHNMLSSQYRPFSVMDIYSMRFQIEF